MKRIFSVAMVAILLSCASGEEPSRETLERVYIGLTMLGVPGRIPGPGEVESLQATIDSLGGRAVVESTLVESMLADAEGWNTLIDSLASEIQ